MSKLLPRFSQIGLMLCALLLLVACESEEIRKKTERNEINKDRLERLLKNRKYDQVRHFIKENSKNEEKESLVEYAIERLNQTDERKNLSFLKGLFTKWIEAKDYETLYQYITSLETEGNGEWVTRFLYDIEDYQDEEEIMADLKKELPKLQSRHDKLVNNHPDPIPLKNPSLLFFSGEIVQRINEQEYRVIDRYRTGEYVLKTFKTVYTSPGHFSMQVVLGQEESYRLQNGFSEELLVLYEVPKENVKTIEEIKQLQDQLSGQFASIKEREQSLKKSGSHLQDLLHTIFQNRNAAESLEKTEGKSSEEGTGKFFVKDNNFYIKGITLEDTTESIVKKLGEPESTEEDVSGDSELVYVYPNMKLGVINEKVTAIEVEVTKKAFEEEIVNHYSGQRYVGEDGTIFLYNKQSDHLLIVKPFGDSLIVYLMYADVLFKKELEEGRIQLQN